MKSILITGSNRGLGLGMVKYLLKSRNQPSNLIATCRKPEEAKELQEITKSFKNVQILKLDLSDLESFTSIFEQVKELTTKNGLNLLINNGGVTSKFTTLNYVKPQQMIDNFTINTIAPIMLTKTLLPLLKVAAEANSNLPVGVNRAAVVNMSSILGSISLNDKGGFYPYRCSKTALNAATKSMSIDLMKDNILTVAIHPGWVKTDMGGKHAPLDVESSIEGLFSSLNNLNSGNSGTFFQYDGKELSW